MQKIEELAEVKKSYEDFVKSAKEMEDEMESAMQVAQQKIEKLSKKNKESNKKLADLTEDYNNNVEEINRLRKELEELKRSQKERAKSEETNSVYIRKYEEVKVTVDELRDENQVLRRRLEEHQEEKVSLQVELENTHAKRYESERKQADRINELQAEVTRLRGQRNESQATVSAEAMARMAEMEEEMKELRAVAASNALVNGAGFVAVDNNYKSIPNKDFFENLVNSQNEQDVYIANIIKTGDVEKLKEALINLLRLYNELKVRNARLLARIQSLQGSVTVCCRTRPPSELEIKQGGKLCIDSSDDSTVFLYDKDQSEWLKHDVDCVWGYDKNQAEVFVDIEPLACAVTCGTDAYVVVYGASESGKSFTATGFDDHLGINYRAILKIFELLQVQRSQPDTIFGEDTLPAQLKPEVKSTMSFRVEMSVMALIEEQAYDLVLSQKLREENAGARENLGKPLDLVYDASEGVADVPFLLKQPVNSASEAMLAFSKIVAAVSDSKGLPAHSHLVMQLTVTVQLNDNAAPTAAKFTVFDLSSVDPKLSKSDAANTGTFALDKVMQALASKSRTVPYSDSKLTKLLHPALTGAAKTMFVVTLSPSHLSLADSKKSLEFAAAARKFRADPAVLAAAAAAAGRSKIGAGSTTEMKNLESKLRILKNDLENAKRRYDFVERKLQETRTSAEQLISQLNDYNDSITNKYQLEKQQNKIVSNDLELTQRNMKKTLDQLNEQIAVNERLLEIVKVYENELAGPSGSKAVTA